METSMLDQLFALQDLEYQRFQCKLMPTVAPERVIGVRTPALRKLAKAWKDAPQTVTFLNTLPHFYYEENNLHGFLLEQQKNFEQAVDAVNRFLPYVDNWATCDMISPKVFGKNHQALLPHIRRWLASDHTYTVRFGIELLMKHFLNEDFSPEFPAWVAEISSEEYYVKMMAAWYFATALAKQWDAVVPYFQQYRLPKWVHNKAIQKSIESYRITAAQKQELRLLRKS